MPDEECIKSKFTEKELDYIAKKLEERMYMNIGKSVVSRFFIIVGVITVALGAYLKSKGFF